MNKIVTNLTLIADAAEYFDRKTSSAWKIRGCLTNMLVWAANSYLYAKRGNDQQRIFDTASVLATLRVWAKDSIESSFTLDLTPSTVRRTLGLEREVDVHEEAVREARMKCIQTRSASKFKQFYDASINAHEERRRQREEAVEDITNLLSDNAFHVSPEMRDYCAAFEQLDLGDIVSDKQLYDDAKVERQYDTLAECVGNALEAMYDVCDGELAAAITTDKINRLSGYHRAIMLMMEVAGVDTKKLAERRAKLEAQIDAMAKEMSGKVEDLDAQIAAQIAEMAQPAAPEPQAEPAKPKRTRVKAAQA